MRRFFKILGIVLASFFGLILLIAVLVKAFENKIAHITAQKVTEQISAPIDVSSVNFNLVRSYPNSKIELNDIWLKDSLDQDTIAGIQHLYLSVNSHKAISGIYEVNAVELDGLALHYTVNKDTLSNIDFLMSMFESTDSTSTLQDSINSNNSDSIALKVNLKQLLMKNILCSYFDSTSNIGATILIPEININATVDGENYKAISKGQIQIKDIHFGDYNTHLIKHTSLDYDLSYDNGEVSLSNILFESDGLRLDLQGKATIGDTIAMNTIIQESYIDFGKMIRYAPQAMLNELGIIDAQGSLTFSSSISGQYIDSLVPEVNANFALENVKVKTNDYPEIKNINLLGSATNGILRNNSSTQLTIDNFELATPQSSLSAKAKIRNIDQPHYTLESKGNITLDEFASFIPDTLLNYLRGKITWDITTYGQMPEEMNDAFTEQVLAQSSIIIGSENLSTKMDSTLTVDSLTTLIAYHNHQITVDTFSASLPSYEVSIQDLKTDIAFEGNVNKLSELKLIINSFSLETDSTYMTLSGQVENLDQPDYSLDADANIHLGSLQKFIPDTLLTALSGRVKAKLKSSAKLHLDSLETQGMQVAFEQSDINVAFEDINAQMADTLFGIKALNMGMDMANDTINISHFSGDYKGTAFNIYNTQITNAYKAVLLNQARELKVRTHIALGDILLSTFEPFMTVDSSAIADSTTTTSTPTNFTMDIKGDIAINSFYIDEYIVDTSMTIRDLDITNFSNKFRITDSTYIVDSMQLNAFDGYINSSFRYDIKEDKEIVAVKSHIDGMDFKSLLYKMDNFGQSDLTDENISGQLTADIFGEAFIEGDSVPMEKVRARGDITLENGGVYDFEAVEELSKFTGLKELDNIRFQTLNTQFFLFKGATYIPKTSIVSTALDANFYGMQSLEEDYEYHIEMFLGDVLTGKSENLMKRQEKAAKDAGDDVKRNGLELKAQSLEGKTKYGFDTKKSQEKMSKKIRLQERILNLVFHHKLFDFSTEEE